nr:MAG TPA: hypothetical protein [Caudoviricetes sp.]
MFNLYYREVCPTCCYLSENTKAALGDGNIVMLAGSGMLLNDETA